MATPAPPALEPEALLRAWEAGLGQVPARRALALLAVARPDLDADARAALSVGERNTALLALRSVVLGDVATALGRCPACGEAFELALPTAQLHAGAPAAGPGPHLLEHEGWRVRFRLLSAGDLAELAERLPDAAGGPGPASEIAAAEARTWLLARCLLAVGAADEPTADADEHTAGSVDAADLPPALVAALAEELSRRDPAAELLLELPCPTCAHTWEAELDVPDFVWRELSAWAQRILLEVHLLASAYGWRQDEVLGLSASRRQAYLELVRGEPAGGGTW